MAVRVFISCVFAAFCLVTINAAPAENVMSLLKVPTACKGQEFCDVKPEGYEHLEQKINSALPDFLKAESDLDDRYADDEGIILSPKKDWHNCPYETKRQSMYLYNHGGNETKIDVFVQTKLFRQYVDVVTCAMKHIDTSSNQQCFQDLGVSNFHMTSACVQSKAKRTLYIYDIERNKVIQKYYEVPSCCSCKVSNE